VEDAPQPDPPIPHRFKGPLHRSRVRQVRLQEAQACHRRLRLPEIQPIDRFPGLQQLFHCRQPHSAGSAGNQYRVHRQKARRTRTAPATASRKRSKSSGTPATLP
jgi:hypothetical protein